VGDSWSCFPLVSTGSSKLAMLAAAATTAYMASVAYIDFFSKTCKYKPIWMVMACQKLSNKQQIISKDYRGNII